MTFRLPTRVKPKSPAFSLHAKEIKEKENEIMSLI